MSEPASPTQSRIDAAIAGTPCKHYFALAPEDLFTEAMYRPVEITNRRQLLTRPFCALTNAVGTGPDRDEAAHDMGHAERHPAYPVAVRRPRRTFAQHASPEHTLPYRRTVRSRAHFT